jgi:membrane protein implicated in regulation of membrane protease activity
VAFFGGIFLAAVIISFELGGYAGPVHFVLLLVSLFASSWALSRFISRTISSRRTQSRLSREDEAERERRALAARARAAAEASEEGTGGAQRRRRKRRS